MRFQKSWYTSVSAFWEIYQLACDPLIGLNSNNSKGWEIFYPSDPLQFIQLFKNILGMRKNVNMQIPQAGNTALSASFAV